MLGWGLLFGCEEIDVSGKLVLFGGVDVYCYLDQLMEEGLCMVDDFCSGIIFVVCGGIIMVILFVVQVKGGLLCVVVEDYYCCVEGKVVIDYVFYMIVSDFSEEVFKKELL